MGEVNSYETQRGFSIFKVWLPRLPWRLALTKKKKKKKQGCVGVGEEIVPRGSHETWEQYTLFLLIPLLRIVMKPYLNARDPQKQSGCQLESRGNSRFLVIS
jgi:hypothetical protein